ncbi:hypothetical protein [Spongiimicrobium sp. 2-473A-2-J]|uniref:hypothetical protein n=1 Tax=Eudoraea algarum TaxID=3417568 RepID=UPI003D36B84B
MKVNLQQDLSPIKFLFFIKPKSRSGFLESVKALFSLWCGVYSPILPYYSRLSKNYKNRYKLNINLIEYYQNIISNFDPDVIVFEDGLNENALKELADGRKLISQSDFIKGLKIGQPISSIHIDTVYDTIIKKEFKYKRVDKLGLTIPKIKDRDLLLCAWQGKVLENVENKFFDNYLLKKPYVEKIDLTYNNVIPFIQNQPISLLLANTHKTRMTGKRVWFNKKALYFLNPNSISDVMDFWNLRALGWTIFPIPIAKKNQVTYEKYIINCLENEGTKGKGFNIADVLISKDIKKKIVVDFLDDLVKKNKIKVSVSYQGWFPRFWINSTEVLKADFVDCPRVVFGNKYESVEVEVEENDYVNIDLPKPPFKLRHTGEMIFKSYFSFNYWSRNGEYAEVIDGISTKDWHKIIGSYFFRENQWKISGSDIIRYIRYKKDNVHFHLPKSFDFFSKYFKNKGFVINDTASGKLGREVLKNVGGIYGANLFSTKNAIKIIELFEGGKVVSVEELVGKLQRYKPYPEIKEPKEVISLFLEKNIIEFGLRIQCSICNQRSFYLPAEIDDNLKCNICRNDFELPKADPKKSIGYLYRGIGPFSRNNKVDGILSVFLTIGLFRKDLDTGPEEMSFIFDFDVAKGTNKFEIDLALITKGGRNSKVNTFICECKTYKDITEKDYNRLKFMGENLPNVTLVISTLKEEFSEAEKSLLIKLTNNFRDGHYTTNPVLLLTGNELVSDDRYFPLKKYEDNMASHNHVDYVKTLADLTCEEHLGLKTCNEISIEAWEKLHGKKDKKKKKKS